MLRWLSAGEAGCLGPPVEAASQLESSISWSFHLLNQTVLQLSAAALFCLSIDLHVKQSVMTGSCMLLSSSGSILLTLPLNQVLTDLWSKLHSVVLAGMLGEHSSCSL